MIHRIVFIIPYFGRIPAYFDLWLRSAKANSDFDFFIYSDLPLSADNASNVKIKHMSFDQLKERIQTKYGKKCIINDPYKLCDYKPAYGDIFSQDINEYDFWGFCDIDLILGKLNHFISDKLLYNADKLYYHGHLCLMRNNEKMNTLFMNKFPHVVDFDYAISTNYICHFDENGTIAHAHKFDKGIRFYSRYDFYDVPYNSYKMLINDNEIYALWHNGVLTLHDFISPHSKEIMYIHLQKREMIWKKDRIKEDIAIFRNLFLPPSELAGSEHFFDTTAEIQFLRHRKSSRKIEIIKNIKRGALRFRLHRFFKRWL